MNLTVTPVQFQAALKNKKRLPNQKKQLFKTLITIVIAIPATIVILTIFEWLPQPQKGDGSSFWFFIGSPLLIVASYFISILIHEMGHVIAGKLNGFNVVLFVVGPFMLIKTPASWHITFSGLNGLMQLGGFVYGYPLYSKNLAQRLTKLYLGGPVASILQLLFLLFLTLLLSNLTLAYPLYWLLRMSLFMGILFVILSCIPTDSMGLSNDAAQIRRLRNKTAGYKALLLHFILNAQLIVGNRPREIDKALFNALLEEAADPARQALAHLDLYARALDAGNIQGAASHLNDSLAAFLEDPATMNTPIAMLEACYFEAFFNQNQKSARQWYTLANKRPKPIDSLINPSRTLRAEAALLLAEEHVRPAREQAQAGVACLRRHFNLGDAIVEYELLQDIIQKTQETRKIVTNRSEQVEVYQPKQGVLPILRSCLTTATAVVVFLCFLTVFIPFIVIPDLRYQLMGNYYCCIVGDNEKAFEIFTAGIENHSGRFIYNFIGRGRLYLENGQYEAAIADFEAAMEIDPDSPVPYLERGHANYVHRKFRPAILDYSKSLELETDEDDIIQLYIYRAAAYTYVHEYDLAAQDYYTILAITDNQPVREKVEQYLKTIGYSIK